MYVDNVYLERWLILLGLLLLMLCIHKHFNRTSLKHSKLWLSITRYYAASMLHALPSLARLEYRHLLIVSEHILLLLLRQFLTDIFATSTILIHSALLLIVRVKVSNKQLWAIVSSVRLSGVKIALVHHNLLIGQTARQSHCLLPLIVYHLLKKNIVIREEIVVSSVPHTTTAAHTESHSGNLPPRHLSTCLMIL